MRKHGFTLVEILILVVILGILAAIVIPQFQQAKKQEREERVSSNTIQQKDLLNTLSEYLGEGREIISVDSAWGEGRKITGYTITTRKLEQE